MKFLLVVAATLAVASAGSIAPGLRAKVKAGQVTEAILELPQVVDQLQDNMAFQALTGDARAHAVATILEGLTSSAQAPYVAVMQSAGLEYEQFWASNIVLVKGLTDKALDTLAEMKGEFIIREQNTVQINAAVIDHNATITQNPQWGVGQIRAPAAWAVSQGEGCVAIIVDTGVHQGHQALSAGYAGAWRDPYYNTAGPTDQHGHGSHCAGSVLGRANGVGVAPAARWIACRGLNHQGSGTEASLTTCSQFSITANPRPHVSSNSWGGGSGATWYDSQITAMRNANIVPVFAIGNSGSSCRSANSPGDRPNNIAVGATTNTDAMATFSSRGPNNAGALKPEVSAPGQNIVSCGTGANNYVTMSGTSMATPHVAGAVCLLYGAHPNWSFQQIFNALTTTGHHPSLGNADRNCGLPTPGQDFPNHAFGHGRIDIGRALGV